jgi:hypothetical protein
MTDRFCFLRFPAALALLGLISGCSTVESLMPHPDPNNILLNQGVSPRQTAGTLPLRPEEKPKVLAVASQDINCPTVDVPDGGSYVRVGGADSASVRYQFNLGDTARECDPGPSGQASIKVGVSGEVVIGPAGSAGTFSVPLRVTVTDLATKKDVFTKTYRIDATTDGVSAGKFRMVTEPIAVPMPTLQLADLYSISVALQGGGEGAGAPRRHRQRTSG